TLIQLLGGLYAVPGGLAVLHRDAAAFVQRELRVDQLAVVLEQPADAVFVAVADFLVGGQRENEVAVGAIALLFEADEGGDQGGGHVFVVGGAAGVEVAVLLDELIGIGGPVLAFSFYYVDVGEEEYRFVLAGAVQARY